MTAKTNRPVVYIVPRLVIRPARTPGDPPSIVPGAPEALRHLRDASFQIVVLFETPGPLMEDLSVGSVGQAELPATVRDGSWLLTDDERACKERRRGLRTILVRPKSRSSHRPAPACDLRARDLFSAVLELLAQQAMA